MWTRASSKWNRASATCSRASTTCSGALTTRTRPASICRGPRKTVQTTEKKGVVAQLLLCVSSVRRGLARSAPHPPASNRGAPGREVPRKGARCETEDCIDRPQELLAPRLPPERILHLLEIPDFLDGHQSTSSVRRSPGWIVPRGSSRRAGRDPAPRPGEPGAGDRRRAGFVWVEKDVEP